MEVVFIIVAIQKNLNHIKQELTDRGYQVVDVESYNYPIDAIVYEGSYFNLSHITSNNMPQMQDGQRGYYGVLLVNSQGKTMDEIEDVLKKRCYTSLF